MNRMIMSKSRTLAVVLPAMFIAAASILLKIQTIEAIKTDIPPSVSKSVRLKRLIR